MAKRPGNGPRRGKADLRNGIPGVRQRPYRPREPVHEPTDAQRLAVASLVSLGHSNEIISQALDIAQRTLERHYAHELKNGREIIHTRVGGSIVAQALSGDKTMQIFYAKAQMGWRDRHSTSFENAKGETVNPSELFTINITG